MPFEATLEKTGNAAVITLSGELDAGSAPAFRERVEEAAGQQVQHLVLQASRLDFMASAGLRVLIFAKQKMGAATDIYVIGAQPHIVDTLRKTGFDRSVILADTYDGGQ